MFSEFRLVAEVIGSMILDARWKASTRTRSHLSNYQFYLKDI